MNIIGIVILAVGVVLLLFGLNSSRAITDKISQSVTGRFTQKTMWYLIGGIALIVAGGALLFLGSQHSIVT